MVQLTTGERRTKMSFYAFVFLLVWVLLLIFLIVKYHFQLRVFGPGAVLLTLLLGVFVLTFPCAVSSADSNLPGIVLICHALFSFLSYGAFTLAFCSASLYVAHERLLKNKSLGLLQQHLPSLEALAELCFKFVSVGVPLLSLGILAGAIWSNLTYGYYLSFRPKELWSIFSWLFFGGYLALHQLAGWSKHKLVYLLIFGSLLVILFYMGVQLL